MSNVAEQIESLRRCIAPVVGALGLELYDVELHGSGPQRVLRVTVDREGGVDIDAVADATRAVSTALDNDSSLEGPSIEGPSLDGPYLLEVSSPGIERSLRLPAHYAGALGSVVSVKLRTLDGTRRVHGTLVESDDESCTVETEGRRERIAFRDVTQARTVFEWNPEPRPGQRRRARAGASSGVRGSKGAGA